MPRDDPAPARPANPSSLVREHLANERTFLAWIRTSLGLIGLGFVLARMGLLLRQLAAASEVFRHHGLHTGHEFVLTGVVFLILGTALGGWSGWQHGRCRIAIDSGSYEPTRKAVITLSAVVGGGGLVIVALVIWRTLISDGP